jgi:predicted transcriptional regulator
MSEESQVRMASDEQLRERRDKEITELIGRIQKNQETIDEYVQKRASQKSELAKRLYQDVKEERLRAFFDAVQKNETELLEKEYADILPLRAKEIEVIVSLFNKNVEMDIKEIDGKAFRKAVMKAQPETKAVTFEMLAPMFIAEKQAEDFSELDELLK